MHYHRVVFSAGWRISVGVPVVLICAAGLCRGAVDGAAVVDIFGRDVTTVGLTVPDWEGYMANPAIEFSIVPPPNAVLPVQVTITAREPRLYFDLPSQAGAQGPRKELKLTGSEPQSASIAIFPARRKHNQETAINIQFIDARRRRGQLVVPIHVMAVEGHDHSPVFPITIDFSQDKTGFYRDPIRRETFEQAVADWAFYLADMHSEPIAAGAERTWIFEPDGFKKSHLVKSEKPYTGYLLYTYGIAGEELRSGGEPSLAGGFQIVDGRALSIRRSGGVEVETRGNYNTRGWLPPLRDDQWWQATNLSDVPNDLYSIVHHESGHALFFNPNNKGFPRNGILKDDAVRAYLGSDARPDVHDHFDGIVDPWSLHGAFGNEYHGRTPYGRWLITRLDLLCAQAIGYKLRETAPFMPLAIQTDQLPEGGRLNAYRAELHAEGGIPSYDWQIAAGNLPPGLLLNRITGQITGTPRQVGKFAFTVRVRDYQKDSAGVDRVFEITIGRQ